MAVKSKTKKRAVPEPKAVVKPRRFAQDLPLILACILACEAAGIIGAVFTTPAIPNWYASLEKPWFNPPGFLFGPVWTALYVMMGVSLYFAIRARTNRRSLYIFGLQLGLNTLWSIAFFGLESPGAAFIIIIALWFAIALTIREFREKSKNAALLLMPYLAWVSFASILNLFIWMLNG